MSFTLHSPRLLIRNLRTDDLDAFHHYRSNPQITTYQDFDVMDRRQAAAFIQEQSERADFQDGQWKQYGIENKLSTKLIGDCGVYIDEPNQSARIGITISHHEQGNGYAKESLLALLAYLFNTLHLHRIVETVDAENLASIALLKSTGFRQEGHFVEHVLFKGRWSSEYQYAMLRREWESLRHS